MPYFYYIVIGNLIRLKGVASILKRIKKKLDTKHPSGLAPDKSANVFLFAFLQARTGKVAEYLI